jgi:hypothetical protein
MYVDLGRQCMLAGGHQGLLETEKSAIEADAGDGRFPRDCDSEKHAISDRAT